jgi:ABC-2 type transport system ATP-binding protein
MAGIEVRGLTKRFGPVLAVETVSFDVERGTVTGFLGSNGAGKTTTLRMLLGLVRPDAGTATINGRPYRDLHEPLHQVGAVLEASSFHPGRTARNHLRVQAMAGQADDPEGVRWLRDLLRGLAADGATVLVSSHMLAEVAQTVDAVVILDHGRLITQSSLAELTAGGTVGLEEAFLGLTRHSRQEVPR